MRYQDHYQTYIKHDFPLSLLPTDYCYVFLNFNSIWLFTNYPHEIYEKVDVD